MHYSIVHLNLQLAVAVHIGHAVTHLRIYREQVVRL